MSQRLNLFPARVPIGSVTDATGQRRDVMMSAEFERALSALFVRVGGANGTNNDDLAAMFGIDEGVSQNQALRAEVAVLRALLEMAGPALSLQRQIDHMRAELALIEDPAAQVRYVLNRYAPLLSPKFTGVPTAPTAVADTNTDQLATTKYVIGQAAGPAEVTQMDATPGRIGVSGRYARSDHAHPTDTSRQASIAKGTVTGSRGGNAALASLLAVMAGQGLITDSTTA